MNNKIVICGKGGSGKDYLRAKLVSKGYRANISYTTRPIREGEVPGVDYWYVDDNEFANMIHDNCFIEYQKFNGWMYGTTRQQFIINDVFIMTPTGVNSLSEKDRKGVLVIYLDIADNIRYNRLLARNDGDAERRMNADNEDFKDFNNYDIRITNPNF